jgi:hypothetical protein
MRRLGFALFLCLISCAAAKADTILAANCAVTPAICADTPSASGTLTTIATDYRGYSDAFYVSGTVTNASHTLYDSTYGTTVSAAVTVGYDGIHGSSSVSPGGSGGAIARFDGQIIDYFQATGNVPSGAQLEVTYGADILSNASLASYSYYSAGLQLNGTNCFDNLYSSGNFTDTCTAYIPISSTDQTATLVLDFFTDLDSSRNSNAFLDATNTAKFDAITVVDAAGNPLSAVQLYDTSGYNYDSAVPPAATPEPSSFLLLTTGLATMTGLARRRLA